MSAGLTLATPIFLLGLALLFLFLPAYMHAALDAAGSAERLGVSRSEAHALSDRTVAELFVGPGRFDFSGPASERFYGADEAAHLRDVRVVLFAFLALAGLSGVALLAALARGSRELAWRALARGGGLLAIFVVVVGLLAIVAFGPVFELFHRIFFPGGNWAFDPGSQRLVQLYPLAFWQLTSAALGLLALLLGAASWLIGRRRAHGHEADTRHDREGRQ